MFSTRERVREGEREGEKERVGGERETSPSPSTRPDQYRWECPYSDIISPGHTFREPALYGANMDRRIHTMELTNGSLTCTLRDGGREGGREREVERGMVPC